MSDVTKEMAAFPYELLDAAPDAIIVADPKGRIALVNSMAEKLYGYSRAELDGQPVEVLIPKRFRESHQRHRIQYHAAPRARPMGSGLELFGLRKDGEEFPVEISLKPISTRAGTYVFSAVRDVTQQKQTEEALKSSLEQLELAELQLRAAAEIQEALRPKEPLVIPGFTIAGRCYPAEFAAGDHFEFLRSPDGSLLVGLGDVCGHGVGPAILTAGFHAQLRALSTDLSDPEEIAAKVNAALHEDTATGMFLTLIVARLDPDSRVLNYVNAGHLPGIVLDLEGQLKARLEGSNFPAGIVPGVTFHKGPPVQLEDGDLVLLSPPATILCLDMNNST
jgi:PAS domain S-box-containing protein